MNESLYDREMADLERSFEEGEITYTQFRQYVRELNEGFADILEGWDG